MYDLILVAAVIAFFGVSSLVVRACERLIGPAARVDEDGEL